MRFDNLDDAARSEHEIRPSLSGISDPTCPKSTGVPFMRAQDALRSVLRRSWLRQSQLMYAGPGRPI
jgi:hypothetical protein